MVSSEKLERTRAITQSSVQNETRDAHLVSNRHDSVSNAERQKGKVLKSSDFIKKLRKINPDFVLVPHPGVLSDNLTYKKMTRDKALLKLNLPGGQSDYLLVCEGDWMPEWTIMTEKELKRPDGSSPDAPWQKVAVPWHVAKRGWREVLIRLIHSHLITKTQAEQTFGLTSRESWKVLTS